jgi:uncharacterized Zn finger protein
MKELAVKCPYCGNVAERLHEEITTPIQDVIRCRQSCGLDWVQIAGRWLEGRKVERAS